MPKLGKRADWKAKKEQIIGMYKRRFFVDSENNSTLDSLPDFWEKDQVIKFYDEEITDEMVNEYLDTLEREKKAKEEARQEEEERLAAEARRKARKEAFEKLYEDTKPTEVSVGVEELKARLEGLGLPEDVYNEILKCHSEELEFRQFEHDGAFSKFNEKDRERLTELNLKYGIENIGEEMDEIAEDKNQLNFYQDEIAKYSTPPRKPGRLIQLFNDFQKTFTGFDIGVVKSYNHYTDAKEKVAQLEEKILESDKRLRDQRRKEKDIADYVTKRVNKPYELAEHIVRESIRNTKEQVQDISKEEFGKHVNTIMDTRIFKILVVDLKVDRLDIKPEIFYKAYMKKIELGQKEEKQKAESVPEKQKTKSADEIEYSKIKKELGLDESATFTQAKSAMRKLFQTNHPDALNRRDSITPQERAEANKVFTRMTEIQKIFAEPKKQEIFTKLDEKIKAEIKTGEPQKEAPKKEAPMAGGPQL